MCGMLEGVTRLNGRLKGSRPDSAEVDTGARSVKSREEKFMAQRIQSECVANVNELKRKGAEGRKRVRLEQKKTAHRLFRAIRIFVWLPRPALASSRYRLEWESTLIASLLPKTFQSMAYQLQRRPPKEYLRMNGWPIANASYYCFDRNIELRQMRQLDWTTIDTNEG